MVGKHLLELFQDDDTDACGDDNVRPQDVLSADTYIYFGPTWEENEVAELEADFYDWWAKADLTGRLGFEQGDPTNALGRCPVASLDREADTAIRGLTDSQIVELVGRHQHIRRLRVVRGDSGCSWRV